MTYKPPSNCKYCGSKDFNLLLAYSNTLIEFKVFRYLCKKCLKTFYEYSRDLYCYEDSLLSRNKCHHCGTKLDDTNEIRMGMCLKCLDISRKRHFSEISLEDFLKYMR